MRRFLLIKTGRALPATRREQGDFEHLFQRGLGIDADQLLLWDISAEQLSEPPDDSCFDAIVITGSAQNVSEAPALVARFSSWLAQQVNQNTPVLGVCFGHQWLAHALGGAVSPNPAGRHLGAAQFSLTAAGRDDDLFADQPSAQSVYVTHQEIVATLPPGAQRLGFCAADPNHSFRIKAAWGVQFHPEFDARVCAHYIDKFAPLLPNEGLCEDSLRSALTESAVPQASVLHRFAQWVAARQPRRW